MITMLVRLCISFTLIVFSNTGLEGHGWEPEANIWSSCGNTINTSTFFRQQEYLNRDVYSGSCVCLGDRAVCTNVTVVPKLPQNISRLSCNFCISSGTIDTHVFENIYSLNLTYLDLSGSGLHSIHNNTFTGFKQLTVLRELDLSDNRLTRIPLLCTDEHLFRGLMTLSLHKNRLKRVTKESLNCFRNLTSLNLGKNMIEELDFQAYEKLTKLVNLDLHSNWLKKVTLHERGLQSSLIYLNLPHNDFALFPPRLCGTNGSINAFPNLTHLNLARNLIGIPYYASWDCMANLKVLNLTNNPIRRLLNNTFSNLTNLVELLISDVIDTIEEIEPLALDNSHMNKLDISNNGLKFDKFETRKEIFSHCSNVTELDISGNDFKGKEEFIHTLLTGMEGLEILNLMSCGIQRLPPNITRTLPNLEVLNMSSNNMNITRIDYAYYNSSLRNLSLATNKIQTLEPTWRAGYENITLKEIDFSDNPFDCGCDPTAKELREGIHENATGTEAYFGTIKMINWPSGYSCESPQSREGIPFKDFNPVYLCKEHDPDNLMFAFIIIASFLFVFFVISAVVFKNIWHIKYWIYKLKKRPGRRRSRRQNNDPEREPLLDDLDVIGRDAFLINHATDDLFVLTDLQKILEDQMGYKLCIFERNCINGAKIELMVDGIYSCEHSIAVVSKSFLKDPWCLFQLDVAFDRRVREKRSSLMLLLLDDIDFRSLNKYWCIMLTKTPTAHWCPTRNDIKRKLFEEQVEKHLGVPVLRQYRRSISV